MKISSSLCRTVLSIVVMCFARLSGEARNDVTINDGWTFSYGSDSVSSAVHLPHCWNTDAYSTRAYCRGVGRYARKLEIPATMSGRRIYLKLDGAAAKSQIRIDGRVAGSHVGAYSPHVADITPYVSPGSTHMLEVTVDNSDRDVPPYSADFTFMGGLYRDVHMIDCAPLHLDFSSGPAAGFRVNTSVMDGGECRAEIRGRVANTTGERVKATVEAAIFAQDGSMVAADSRRVSFRKGETSSQFAISFDRLSGIKLWEPDSANLYTVKVTLRAGDSVADTSTETIGFRTFAFDADGRFLLNGRPYKLRGMCRHQDQAPMGIALVDEQHRRDMRLIKDMGANFVRISHYPQDDAILEMCDRLGLIVWEEIPVIDYVPESARFADNCETMLREMIASHYNHPSVAMWGYMNEILLRMPRENQEETKARTVALAHRLENVLAEEDSTRMSAMAFHGSDIYHSARLGEITDVKGWNLYQGWYGGRFRDFESFLSRQHREHPHHRLIVSEYGAGSDLRIHSLEPEAFDFSMEYQQDYLEHYVPVIEDSTFVAGASHWNFIDFSSANRAESMPHINNKGLVTNTRRKKDVYYYYSARWHDAPGSPTVAHIATRDWTDRTEIVGPEGSVTRPVKVYTNLPVVVMKVNGVTLDAVAAENCTAVFDVQFVPGVNVIELASAESPERTLDAVTVNLNAIRSERGVIDPETSDFAINVGSNCYYRSDDTGLTWLPDRPYTPGGLYGHIGGKRTVSQDEIACTSDGPLLQRGLTDVESYRVDVVPGRYEVELSFADLSSPSALSAYMLGRNAGTGSDRPACMDVSICGTQVERAFAPAKVGGVKSRVTRRYITTVEPGCPLIVDMKPAERGSTLISALKIRKL